MVLLVDIGTIIMIFVLLVLAIFLPEMMLGLGSWMDRHAILILVVVVLFCLFRVYLEKMAWEFNIIIIIISNVLRTIPFVLFFAAIIYDFSHGQIGLLGGILVTFFTILAILLYLTIYLFGESLTLFAAEKNEILYLATSILQFVTSYWCTMFLAEREVNIILDSVIQMFN